MPSLIAWGWGLLGGLAGGALEWAGCPEGAGLCWGAALTGLLLSRRPDGALVPGPTPVADSPPVPEKKETSPVLVPLPQAVNSGIPGVPVSRERAPNSRSSSVRRAYHPAPPPTRPPSTRSFLRTPGVRLLVMDEDDISRQTICATLEAWGIDSQGVTSPAEAALQIRVGQQAGQPMNALILLGSHSSAEATGMVDRVAKDLGLQPIRIIRLSLMGGPGDGPTSRIQTLPLPLEENSFREALTREIPGTATTTPTGESLVHPMVDVPPLPLSRTSQEKPDSHALDGVFDPRILNDLLDQLGADGPQVIAGLISDFLAGIEDQLARLEAAIAAGDPERVAGVSHRLRGQCLQLGLQRLVTLLQTLESSANEQNLAHAREQFQLIQRTWGPSKTALLNRE